MKQRIMEEIVQQMLPHLDNAQLQKLQEVLEHSLYNYEISGKVTEAEDDSQKLIDSFVYAKRIEGCSEKTLKYYRTTIEAMTEAVDKGVVYFDARTKIHLKNYIDSRNDENPALFVTLRYPHTRITIGGIESRLREMGKVLEIEKLHPHKFRRTLATMAIDKGMPIEQLQQLLGHKRIDTTLQYAMVKQSNVKQAHRKYIG